VVDLTADGADDTDKKAPEGMAAEMALSGPTTLPALCGLSLIREIREIRGPFFGRSRVCRPPRLCAPQLCGFCVSAVRRKGPADHAEGRRTGRGPGFPLKELRRETRQDSAPPRRGSLTDLSFVAVVSRSIAIHRD